MDRSLRYSASALRAHENRPCYGARSVFPQSDPSTFLPETSLPARIDLDACCVGSPSTGFRNGHNFTHGGRGDIFVAGVRLWFFGGAILAAGASLPILWSFLHGYQQDRILTFFDPSQDALGKGYHITQSKIALGSGGLWGKGFMQGTQASLNFLPEKQTDFIFTLFCEEWGFVGGAFLIMLYVGLILMCYRIVMTTQNAFGRFVSMGMTMTFFLYVFINIAMVMGLLPVVGVPLPLVSYGGTAMLTLLMGFGFLLNVGIHRPLKIPRLSIGVF